MDGGPVRWRLPGPPAMIRHRPRTRGVAAQHASLSRWRSPVRIRSGPPSLTDSSHAPSARPDGAFLCPPTAVTSPVRYPAARDRPRSRLQPEGAQSPPRDARRGSCPRSSSRSSSASGSGSGASCSAASAGPRHRPRPPRSRRRHGLPGRPGRDTRRGRSPQASRLRPRPSGVGGARPARRVGRRDRPGHELPVGPDRPRGRRTCARSRAGTARTRASPSSRRTRTRSSRRSA